MPRRSCSIDVASQFKLLDISYGFTVVTSLGTKLGKWGNIRQLKTLGVRASKGGFAVGYASADMNAVDAAQTTSHLGN
jgi:hypothetical protein